MNINRIKKNIKKVEEIVESIDVQDLINRMEKDKENSIEEFEELFGNTPFENIKKIQHYIDKNYIPIQKIKDKIERIQEEGYWLFTTDRDSDKCVEVLQQLLEKE